MPIDIEALRADPDFQKLSPADQQDLLATAQQRNQASAPPAPVEPAVSAQTPGPLQALWGAVTGTQRLPFQAGAPPEGVNTADVATQRLRESPFGQVVGPVVEPMVQPSSIGEFAGTMLGSGKVRPFFGAAGAGVGEGYRQWEAGEPFDVTKMGKEAAWSLAPELAESVGRAALKTAARGTSSGQALMKEKAVQQGRQVPERVFEPRPEAEISAAFDTVRQSGVQIDSSDMVRRMQTMPPGKQAALLDEISWIDQHNRTGGRYSQLLEQLRKPSTSNNVDIGALQDLRSQLRKRSATLPEGEARQLMRDFQAVVDDTIFHGPATGANIAATRETLMQARQDWARRIAADDMSDLLEDKIRSSQDLSMVSLNLAGFYDQLRRGRSEISRSVDRAIDLMPGGRERFDTAMQDVAQQFQYVNLPKVPGMQQALSLIMLSPTWRERLRGAIVDGRGTVSPNAFAMIANAARREMMPELTGATQTPPREGVESWFAPGGAARSTD